MEKIKDKLMARAAAVVVSLLSMSVSVFGQTVTFNSALQKVETMEKNSRDLIFRIVAYMIGFICLGGLGYQIFMRVKEGEGRGNSGILTWFIITLLAVGGMEIVKALFFT